MSTEAAAGARRWFEEVWNQRRAQTIDALLDPNVIGHAEGGDIRSPAEFHQRMFAPLCGAFPDLRVTIDGIVSEGDDAVVRWTAKATHRGAIFGVEGTGRPVEFRGMTWMHFRDGKVVEAWDAWNQGALAASLSA